MKRNKHQGEIIVPFMKKSFLSLLITTSLFGIGILQAYGINNYFPENELFPNLSDNGVVQVSDAFEMEHSDIQQLTIIGKVTDKQTGEPMPGVNIVVKGTSIGTMSDIDGNYSLAVSDGNVTLVFSFIGYVNQEVPLQGRSSINVALVSETVGLDEVVVVGYGTQKKLELTSAVSSIKSDDFVKGSIKDAAQLIKGQVAGVSIINPNADPTATSQILLRGVTTLASGTQPLVVIDGVPGGLKDVAPEDIESIDILKDGSAAAIYGTRGTNGVVLITTKKVRTEMPSTIEWNSYVTTQVVTKYLEMMNADDIKNLAAQNKPGAFNYGSNTNWIDEVFRTPISHTHNVSMKGGTINSNYIVNLNYKALQGLMLKSDNNLFNTRIEANHSMFDGKIKINANIMGYDQKFFSGASGSSWRSDVYRYALIYNPTDPVKDANGNWTEHLDNNYRNPVSLIMETDGQIHITNVRPFGTITYSPIKGLTFKALGSHNIYRSNSGYYETSKNVQSILSNRKGYAAKSTSESNEDLLELTATYLKSFGQHNFTFLGGYTYNKVTSESFSANNYNFPSDLYSYNNLSLGTARTSGLAGMSSNKSS